MINYCIDNTIIENDNYLHIGEEYFRCVRKYFILLDIPLEEVHKLFEKHDNMLQLLSSIISVYQLDEGLLHSCCFLINVQYSLTDIKQLENLTKVRNRNKYCEVLKPDYLLHFKQQILNNNMPQYYHASLILMQKFNSTLLYISSKLKHKFVVHEMLYVELLLTIDGQLNKKIIHYLNML